MNEEEAANELKQIYRLEPRVGINVRGMSEYYVVLTARIGPSDGKTGLDVVAKITAVFRRRGGAGAPLPVALTSSGFLEQGLVQRVQDRLAHSAPRNPGATLDPARDGVASRVPSVESARLRHCFRFPYVMS
jgi:hypothetical protein